METLSQSRFKFQITLDLYQVDKKLVRTRTQHQTQDLPTICYRVALLLGSMLSDVHAFIFSYFKERPKGMDVLDRWLQGESAGSVGNLVL